MKNKYLYKNWEENDVFAWKINCENPKYEKYNGKYMLFIYTKKTYNDSKIFRIKITEDNKLPTTYDEINNLEYKLIDISGWVSLRVHKLRTEQLIEEYNNPTFFPDEYGDFYNYFFQIIDLTQKKVKENWIYIGNYNIDKPKNEKTILDKNNNEMFLMHMHYAIFKYAIEYILSIPDDIYKSLTLEQKIQIELHNLKPIIGILKANLLPGQKNYNLSFDEWIKIILTLPKSDSNQQYKINIYEEYTKRKGDLSDIDSEALTKLFLRK